MSFFFWISIIKHYYHNFQIIFETLIFLHRSSHFNSMNWHPNTDIFAILQLNSDVNYFQRKFVNEVRRCDEMERKLRYIEAEVKKDGVPFADNIAESPRAPNPREIINLEVHIFLWKFSRLFSKNHHTFANWLKKKFLVIAFEVQTAYRFNF